MNPLNSFISSDRFEQLLHEADTERLARLLSDGGTRSAWRRVTGSAARRLSVTLDGVATKLDPVCRPTYGRPSYGRE